MDIFKYYTLFPIYMTESGKVVKKYSSFVIDKDFGELDTTDGDQEIASLALITDYNSSNEGLEHPFGNLFGEEYPPFMYTAEVRSAVGWYELMQKDHNLMVEELLVKLIVGESVIPAHSFQLGGSRTMAHQEDIIIKHLRACKDLEERLKDRGFMVENVPPWDGFAVSSASGIEHDNPFYTLETRLRGPKRSWPVGFVIGNESLPELTVVSKELITPSGIKMSSYVRRPDNSEVSVYEGSNKGGVPLLLQHWKQIKGILERTMEYHLQRYGEDKRMIFAESSLRYAHTLSHVDSWDADYEALMQRAEQIAKVILGKSKLKDIVKEVVLYGSLAKKDKHPRDIDLLLVVDSDEQLNPLRYQAREKPSRYDIAAVTNGLGNELGIVEELYAFYGIKPQFGSGISSLNLDLNAIPTRFLTDPETRKRFIESVYPSGYQWRALTDGLAFNTETGKFDRPTKDMYKGPLEQLRAELKELARQGYGLI